MATVTIQKLDGAQGGSLELSDAVFGVEVNERCVRTAYNQARAAQRAGTSSTKTRGEVSGGGKKPFKQKGTGRARQGTRRAPHMKGGAVIFGPSPRDYTYKINRKERRAALTSLLTSHLSEGTLTVVETLAFEAPKTKQFVGVLNALGLAEARRILVVVGDTEESVLLSARNLQHVKVVNANNLNVIDLLTAYRVVATREAIRSIESALGGPIRAKAGAGAPEAEQ